MVTKIKIKYINAELEPDIFENAEVAIAPPGLIVIKNSHGMLAFFPIGALAGIIFPDGPSLIETLGG